MHSVIKLITLTACLLTASTCFAEQIFWGIEYWTQDLSSPARRLHIMRVDLQAKGIRPFVTPELDGGRLTTSQFVNQYGVQVGINTAFFDIGYTNKAFGYFVSDGKAYQNNYEAWDNPTIGFDPKNKFYLDDSHVHMNTRPLMYQAASGSDVLISDGVNYKDHYVSADEYDFCFGPHPRTAAGIDKTGRYFYMVVVDGINNSGVTLPTLGDDLLNLGLYNAINLDGGGSSTMAIQGRGAVNNPADGAQRLVASHLGFFANATCEKSEEICNGVDDDCNGTADDFGICDGEDDPAYQSHIYENQNTDIDGDGKADICARGHQGIYCTFSSSNDIKTVTSLNNLSDENGWDDPSNYATIRFTDFNGDGKADLCARDNFGIKCWISDGKSFFQSTDYIQMKDEEGYNDVKYYSTIRFADINGDGRSDACARFKDSFQCYPSKGSGWDTPVVLNDMGDENGWGERKYYSTIRMADVNGDGKDDLCARGYDGFRCWLSKGNSFEPSFLAAEWSDENGWSRERFFETIRTPDINGDGKADICARNSETLVCHLSEGSGMGPEIKGPRLADEEGWGDYDNYSTIRFGDINGDKKDDFCIRSIKDYACYLSTGSGFEQKLSMTEINNDNGWGNVSQFRTIQIADINGDGKQEVCGRASTGIQCFNYNGNAFEKTEGPEFSDEGSWGAIQYYSTIRIGGPITKPCTKLQEICDGKDNNCNGQIDENDVCPKEPDPPTQTEDPKDPDNPTEPDEPTEPDDPANPDEPTDSKDPINPDEPTPPNESTHPNEPGNSEEPENGNNITYNSHRCSTMLKSEHSSTNAFGLLSGLLVLALLRKRRENKYHP